MERRTELREKKNSTKFKTFAIMLIICIVLCIIWFIYLMIGKTSISGEPGGGVAIEYVKCKTESVEYPILSRAKPIEQEIDINLFFDGGKLMTVGLIHTQTYRDEAGVYGADAVSEADFNIAAARAGFDADDIGRKFTPKGNQLILNLYAKGDNINDKTANFFLIKKDDDGKILPKTEEDYIDNYQEQGFICETKLDND